MYFLYKMIPILKVIINGFILLSKINIKILIILLLLLILERILIFLNRVWKLTNFHLKITKQQVMVGANVAKI